MSDCKRYKVVSIGKDRLGKVEIRTNYNKTECSGEVGNCGCIHSEIALLEVMPDPELVIVSHSPCINCAKALVESGVERVYYVSRYRLDDGIKYLLENDVEVAQIGAGELIKEVM